MICYLAFFFGIINTHNILVAYAFGFIAGIANSFLDAGTYPSLMEAFPRAPGTANVLISVYFRRAVSVTDDHQPAGVGGTVVWLVVLIAAAIMILNGVFFAALHVSTAPRGQALAAKPAPDSGNAG